MFRHSPSYDLSSTYLSIGGGGGPAKNFHGVDIGPLSKILAVKCAATVSILV